MQLHCIGREGSIGFDDGDWHTYGEDGVGELSSLLPWLSFVRFFLRKPSDGM